MRIFILSLAAIALLCTVSLTGCTSPAEKVSNAQEKVKDANADLSKANQEYLADIENYRKQTNEHIRANAKNLAEFKARTAADKKEAKEDYQAKIEALEKRNSDLQKSIEDYKADGKENWERFKFEFNSDLDELRKAYEEMVEKSKN